MRAYTAVVTREGDNWLGDIPAVPGAHTYAKTLASLVNYLREVAILMDDLPDGAEVLIKLDFKTDDKNVQAGSELGEERERLAAMERQLAEGTATLAGRLAERFGVRDAAAILGVSPGRISQLARAARSA
ncbi:MAG: hypothetical protein LBC97_10875 [Bifidobacteriaceae bacterium]|nr:hypothetical protein [Bifidobacteriaceae bacterium]